MEILPLVLTPSSFTLFIAPPAWGKTYLLLDMFKRGNKKWIYLSPLRALANEFAAKVKHILPTYCIQHKKDLRIMAKNVKKSKACVVVLTPEVVTNQFISLLDEDYVVICDEFHLFYKWGHGFRPILWEVMLGMINKGVSLLALSATITEDLYVFIKNYMYLGFEDIFLIDIGNHKFKNPPSKINYISESMGARIDQLVNLNISKNLYTVLIFCKYRNQVNELVSWFKENGIDAIGCKGGEGQYFQDRLEKAGKVKIIISTTVLSHGVNLPRVSQVFFNYCVNDYSMWIQMVGRGGRTGEEFEVFTCDNFGSSWYKRWISIFKYFIRLKVYDCVGI